MTAPVRRVEPRIWQPCRYLAAEGMESVHHSIFVLQEAVETALNAFDDANTVIGAGSGSPQPVTCTLNQQLCISRSNRRPHPHQPHAPVAPPAPLQSLSATTRKRMAGRAIQVGFVQCGMCW